MAAEQATDTTRVYFQAAGDYITTKGRQHGGRIRCVASRVAAVLLRKKGAWTACLQVGQHAADLRGGDALHQGADGSRRHLQQPKHIVPQV